MRLFPFLAGRCIPQNVVDENFGVLALDVGQQPGCLTAARNGHLSSRIAQPLVHGVDRQSKMPGHRFRIIPVDKQAQGFFFFSGESLITRCHWFYLISRHAGGQSRNCDFGHLPQINRIWLIAPSYIGYMTIPYHPPVKRSVTIAGHETSISLEPAFWTALGKAAEEAGLPLNALIAQVDVARIAAANPPNLASALRVWVLLNTRPA
jgi:predicted DNA-binding ribbon-helix-helix protein